MCLAVQGNGILTGESNVPVKEQWALKFTLTSDH